MTSSLSSARVQIPLLDAAASLDKGENKVKMDDFDKLMRMWDLKLSQNQRTLLVETIERDRNDRDLFRVDWLIDDLDELSQGKTTLKRTKTRQVDGKSTCSQSPMKSSLPTRTAKAK